MAGRPPEWQGGPVGPTITRIQHISLTVRDPEASVTWYERAFGWQQVPVPFRHYEQEETGHGILLVGPGAGIELHTNTASGGEVFDESGTGLDHVPFEVADRAALEVWTAHLDRVEVAHTGIRDVAEPLPFSTVSDRE